ncbi:hypothetical protein TAMA11512_13640 [Selenomonas sp. TAMA-11512]|uniref:DUF4127 family protein n=1 Tax=Selenomonas sp. TAMA-11512 TaxID=3095337 RepID=UPI0030891E26|nr:hypothetical protein TAMA11512_13640 [Selenomonas sp. TAMA-11512]
MTKYAFEILFLLLLASSLAVYTLYRSEPSGDPITAPIETSKKLLLLPLDGRPPCKSDVIERGRLVGYEVITPPADISDYYTKKADTKALEEFLEVHIDEADFVLLSMDCLLYGSLLASREGDVGENDLTSSLEFLRRLHVKHPNIPIEAFFILPRLAPPAAVEDYFDNKNLIEYSKHIDRYTLTGDENDARCITELEKSISPDARNLYLRRFEENERIAHALIDMTQDGTLTRLWIGQDDGAVYSIGNLEKRRLQERLARESIPGERVAILHGADELALTMLTAHEANAAAYSPRIYLDYNHPATPDAVLPYMAISMEQAAKEKIHLLGGKVVSDLEDADLILYLSEGSTETLSSRRTAAKKIKEYLTSGIPIALVDLSEHFLAEETIFPFLLELSVPLHALTSYAGWNTTSNSVGTALSDALLYQIALSRATDDDACLAIIREHIAILDASFIEDYYYLKDVIDLINTGLKTQGYKNVNDLDLSGNYLWAAARLQELLVERSNTLAATQAYRAPFSVSSSMGNYTLRTNTLRIDASFPWPRTFEIYLRVIPAVLWIRQ